MNEIQAVGVEAVSGAPEESPGITRGERPWIYALLIAPSAVVANGIVQGGVLGQLLHQQGVSIGVQSDLIDFLSLPTILYFLWSPITDFFVRRRIWLLTGSIVASLLMAIAFHQPNLSSHGTVMLMLISACCSQLVVSSCGGMMGTLRSVQTRNTASGFYQAGSMGFGALSAALLIWMSSYVNRDTLGLTAAAMIGLPVLVAFAAPAQEKIADTSFGKTMGRIWQECKSTFFRVEAIPYVLCMTFPMASGSAIGLLPNVAHEYGLSTDRVAWITGIGGLLTAAGAAGMALMRTRMRAPVLYMIVALINCATLAILWLGPLRPSNYYLGVTLYLFTEGACYAMFTAVVLEFLGHSGKSGSGRYSIINSLGNVPVLYMIKMDGWGGEHWGGRGLAGTECVIGAIGASILLTWFLTMGRKPAPQS